MITAIMMTCQLHSKRLCMTLRKFAANLCNTVSAPFEVVCAATGYNAVATSDTAGLFKAIVAATAIPAAIMLLAA